MSDNQNDDLSKHYSDDNFWEKVRRFATAAGKKVLEPAMTLYYCLNDEDTPIKDVAICISALAYFIWPWDAIPDPTPMYGYADDLGVVLSALRAASNSIKEEHKQKAKDWCNKTFGTDNEEGTEATT